MLGAAVLSAFAGIVADPLQRRFGLHRRRLHRFIDALERQWMDGTEGAFMVRDHYAARLLDLLDLLTSAWRLAR
jgi:predicted DNA-binding transcriptional regulator YafY